jgi:DNA helicase-2/ATP-dependent DNA helicase PcrA
MTQNPDFPAEQQRLASTVSTMQQKVKEIAGKEVHGADAYTDAVVSWNYANFRRDLELNKDEPYFARIDFQAEGRDCEQIYIGKANLDLGEYTVYSWYSDVAMLRHETKEHLSYKCPKGRVKGRLFLNRNLSVKEARLHAVHDVVNRHGGRSGVVAVSASQAHLLAELYNRGEARLKDIVATIQKEQDRIIRADPKGVLVVNGVAGSGKTQIAFHRLAYLLSPGNRERFKLDASRTVVFVPNELFLGHVKDLLPSLNISGVKQTTFNLWATGLLFPKRDVKVIDRAGDALGRLQVRAQTRSRHLTLATLKGSSRFVSLLERLLDHHRQTLRIDQDVYEFTDVGGVSATVTLSRSDIEEAHARVLKGRLSFRQQRAMVQKNLLVHLSNQAWRQLGRLLHAYKGPFEAELGKQLGALLDEIWPDIGAAQTYYEWLTDEALLASCGQDLLTEGEAAFLAGNTKPANRNFDVQDLSAILYLHTRIEGVSRDETFDHIVIDEGQDLSPLQYHVLRLFQSAPSLTVVGDVAQGVYAYRGLGEWSALGEIYGALPKRLDVTQNYRSTEEIVAFTNGVLAATWRNAGQAAQQLAKPFARSGGEVAVTQCSSFDAMVERATASIRELGDAGVRNIAVIIKDERTGREVAKHFQKAGLEATVLTAQEQTYKGGLAVLTPATAKGLEFPAVIVFGADAKTYNTRNRLDGPLLYVALTRALHHLHVIYEGDVSPFLADVVPEEPSESDVVQDLAEVDGQPSSYPSAPPHPAPFHSFAGNGSTASKDGATEPRDGSKGFGHLFRDGGRFGSYPLHDRYDDEANAD